MRFIFWTSIFLFLSLHYSVEKSTLRLNTGDKGENISLLERGFRHGHYKYRGKHIQGMKRTHNFPHRKIPPGSRVNARTDIRTVSIVLNLDRNEINGTRLKVKAMPTPRLVAAEREQSIPLTTTSSTMTTTAKPPTPLVPRILPRKRRIQRRSIFLNPLQDDGQHKYKGTKRTDGKRSHNYHRDRQKSVSQLSRARKKRDSKLSQEQTERGLTTLPGRDRKGTHNYPKGRQKVVPQLSKGLQKAISQLSHRHIERGRTTLLRRNRKRFHHHPHRKRLPGSRVNAKTRINSLSVVVNLSANKINGTKLNTMTNTTRKAAANSGTRVYVVRAMTSSSVKSASSGALKALHGFARERFSRVTTRPTNSAPISESKTKIIRPLLTTPSVKFTTTPQSRLLSAERELSIPLKTAPIPTVTTALPPTPRIPRILPRIRRVPKRSIFGPFAPATTKAPGTCNINHQMLLNIINTLQDIRVQMDSINFAMYGHNNRVDQKSTFPPYTTSPPFPGEYRGFSPVPYPPYADHVDHIVYLPGPIGKRKAPATILSRVTRSPPTRQRRSARGRSDYHNARYNKRLATTKPPPKPPATPSTAKPESKPEAKPEAKPAADNTSNEVKTEVKTPDLQLSLHGKMNESKYKDRLINKLINALYGKVEHNKADPNAASLPAFNKLIMSLRKLNGKLRESLNQLTNQETAHFNIETSNIRATGENLEKLRQDFHDMIRGIQNKISLLLSAEDEMKRVLQNTLTSLMDSFRGVLLAMDQKCNCKYAYSVTTPLPMIMLPPAYNPYPMFPHPHKRKRSKHSHFFRRSTHSSTKGRQTRFYPYQFNLPDETSPNPPTVNESQSQNIDTSLAPSYGMPYGYGEINPAMQWGEPNVAMPSEQMQTPLNSAGMVAPGKESQYTLPASERFTSNAQDIAIGDTGMPMTQKTAKKRAAGNLPDKYHSMETGSGER